MPDELTNEAREQPVPPIPMSSDEKLAMLHDYLKRDKPSPAVIDAAIGDTAVIPHPDVDVTLHPSRDIPIAGELWSIAGEVHNRSEVPIWIVDSTTAISLAPEMYGSSKRTGSVGAFFPTIPSRPTSEIVRVDPGANYAVIWKLDPLSEKESSPKPRTAFRRVINSIRDYAFFNPGKFRVSATVHVWQTKPQVGESGIVTNTGASFPITVSKEIIMEASPWVLILGAACGAFLCFVLQLLTGRVLLGNSLGSVLKGTAVGLSTALILSGVVTVLISRLATTDFIVVVKVKDLWGAIATGFAIQWFGYSLVEKLIGRAPH
jgi:hypothetical protein